MLAADERAEGGAGTEGLFAPAARVAADAAQSLPRSLLPDRIGPYRILELLGEGGMGVVYRAEQTEPVHREVALKLVRAEVDSAAAMSRFELERQALAMMDHPNVARLYDAGTTDEGRPYFVMELVRGVPITEHCRAHDASLRGRVELFLGVCRGVRHAHRRGVIHRDLKPSNILVTEEEGQVVPKVIDFSIAKALEAPGLGTEFRTRTGQVIGTLEYMSPEQAAGRVGAVDTRSDVYALGVVLYELLAGRLPYDIAGQPMHEAVRRIVEEPARPLKGPGSTVSGRPDEDLATIVGKCLEKEPDRRYGSAADLAEDLERYLDSRPIRARPPTAIYQVRKLVGRHRAIFVSIALGVILLLAFSITVTVQLGIQRRERLRAESEARKAKRINSFLQEMLAAADPASDGGKVSIREVLDQAAGRMDKGLEGQPEVSAELHRTLGLTYKALGVGDGAREQLAKSLALRIELYGEDHPETARARLDLAQQLSADGRSAQAEREARRALEVFRHAQGDPADVAESLNVLADIFYRRGRLEESRKAAEESLVMQKTSPGGSDPLRGRTLNTLGVTLTDLARRQEGEALLRDSASIMKAAYGERNMVHLNVLSDLSYNLQTQGRLEEAISMDQEILAGRLDVLGKDHGLIAISQNNLAVALAERGRCTEAEVHEREALRIWVQSFGEDYELVARARTNLGYFRQCFGDYQGALEELESARRMAERRPTDYVSLMPDLYGNRGVVEERLGHLPEGERLVRRWLDAIGERSGADSPDRWNPLDELGSLLMEEGRPVEAEPELREAMRLLSSTSRQTGRPLEEEPSYALVLNALGRCLAAQGKSQEAEDLLRQARASLLKSTEAADTRRHELMRTAEIYDRLDRPSEAAVYRGALERLDKVTKAKGETR